MPPKPAAKAPAKGAAKPPVKPAAKKPAAGETKDKEGISDENKDLGPVEDEAALKIQKGFRQFLAKKEVEKRRKEKKDKKAPEKANEAAVVKPEGEVTTQAANT